MNITGSTNTCVITANVPFYQSGNTDGSSSTSVITITDENGLDLTNCFGITTRIDTITSTNISTGTTTSGGTTIQSGGTTTTPVGFDTSTLTGACQNIIIIDPVETGTTETECLYTGITFLDTAVVETDGLILVTYSDGSTSLNVHPDCCTSLSYTPEIGTEQYYVCRYRDFYDPTDCNNFSISGTIVKDIDGYVIFNKASGDTTTIVPKIQCCTKYDLQEVVLIDGIHCKERVAPVCAGYVIEATVPDIGDAEFTVLATGQITTIVPTLECCTVNGLSGREVSGGFICYKSANPPTVQITLTSTCCNEVPNTLPMTTYCYKPLWECGPDAVHPLLGQITYWDEFNNEIKETGHCGPADTVLSFSSSRVPTPTPGLGAITCPSGVGGCSQGYNYHITNSTSTAPCGNFIPSSFPIGVVNYNSMSLNSYVTFANNSPFIGNGNWYYYVEDLCGTASKFNAVRINSSGKVTEIAPCLLNT